MAVSDSVGLIKLFRRIPEGSLYQAVAAVSGDASGGNATVTVTFPRTPTAMWRILDIMVEGAASTLHPVSFLGYYVLAKGATFVTRTMRVTLDSTGDLSPEDAVNLVQAAPLFWVHPGNLAAGQPAIQVVTPNVNGTTYRLALTCVSLPVYNERERAYAVVP